MIWYKCQGTCSLLMMRQVRERGFVVQAACFCAAQFFSSYPWGWLSDRVGRKPLLLMSNLSSCISVLGFGLSTSFPQAAICRILGGFFNCTFMSVGFTFHSLLPKQ